MDPTQFPAGNYLFPQGIFPLGVFLTDRERDDYLSTLDSDTRDYVLKHTDEFRTRQDIINCVDRLHNGS